MVNCLVLKKTPCCSTKDYNGIWIVKRLWLDAVRMMGMKTMYWSQCYLVLLDFGWKEYVFYVVLHVIGADVIGVIMNL
jgi:hypothetical protein